MRDHVCLKFTLKYLPKLIIASQVLIIFNGLNWPGYWLINALSHKIIIILLQNIENR